MQWALVLWSKSMACSTPQAVLSCCSSTLCRWSTCCRGKLSGSRTRPAAQGRGHSPVARGQRMDGDELASAVAGPVSDREPVVPDRSDCTSETSPGHPGRPVDRSGNGVATSQRSPMPPARRLHASESPGGPTSPWWTDWLLIAVSALSALRTLPRSFSGPPLSDGNQLLMLRQAQQLP